MKTVSTLAAGLALLAVAALAGSVVGGDKGPSIEEIMTKAHDEENGLLEKISQGLQGGKWDDVTRQTKALVPLAEALGKAKPAKGTAASWKRLCDEYTAMARSLDAAAAKKDKDGAEKALKTLERSCGGCHKAHKS
jgi:cytochrome c556